MPTEQPYRLAVLYSEPAPYTLACLRRLNEAHGVKILAVFWRPAEAAPFVFDTGGFIVRQYARNELDESAMIQVLDEFKPHGLFVSGWMDKGYLRVARRVRQMGVTVVSGLDGQWHGTLRQYVATWLGRHYLQECFDILWVTGERQAQYARRLGFHGTRLRHGFYCCDWEHYAALYDPAVPTPAGVFLYLGRYAPEKGLSDLLAAYRAYREQSANPWELHCVGTGPLKGLLAGQPGVRDLGFLQSDELPGVLRGAAALVLPSTYEPWGVAIQEAAAAGRVLVCSDACGAAVHLLQDRYNGYLFAAGDVPALAGCLEAVERLSAEERRAMGRASHELSRQFTPDRWAETMVRLMVDRVQP